MPLVPLSAFSSYVSQGYTPASGPMGAPYSSSMTGDMLGLGLGIATAAMGGHQTDRPDRTSLSSSSAVSVSGVQVYTK